MILLFLILSAAPYNLRAAWPNSRALALLAVCFWISCPQRWRNKRHRRCHPSLFLISNIINYPLFGLFNQFNSFFSIPDLLRVAGHHPGAFSGWW
ncbi:hypothetical protein BGZ63DRAFT_58487 [Mariannaea sp. PMI_226]|nr:hypothetical protein BGZ63DRAFT_58487 [Mariannaea sp. PMI_226]